jgi:hypothetical protein
MTWGAPIFILSFTHLSRISIISGIGDEFK